MKSETANLIKIRQEQTLERIRNYRLMDDEFMSRVFDRQLEETALVLRTILEKDDLQMIRVVAQKEVKNLQGRSARLDIWAVDSNHIYHIERMIRETGELFNDQEHIICVNGAYDDETTDLGRLMHDFRESDPDKMYSRALSRRASFFKKTEEGRKMVSRALEELVDELILQRDKEKIAQKLREGVTPEHIHEFFDEYPMDLILQVQQEIFEKA